MTFEAYFVIINMIGIGDKMRKIGGRNFWIILIISIVSLIVLTIGVVFLTKSAEKEFYSAGYIINSTATKTDKYYFSDDTVYKENVFEEYVFKDVDDKEVSASKENFIHYLDNSMSFMKNGVILDLDNFETALVPYYNITDKSLIKYNNGSYYIENSDKMLIFSNFLGRITENKYIVVGTDIEIKLSGNDNPVSGEYFEILFIEDGIVKIENQEGSYQTISDGTVIYVGDDIKIDLGTKKVMLGEEEKLSLSEMTIDGNENIDIDPDGAVKEEDSSEDGTIGESGTEDDGSSSGGETGDDTSGEGQDGTDGDEVTSIIKKEVSVDLITAEAGINDLSASFQVIDTDNFIKGNLILTLTNTTTGNVVYTKTLSKAADLQNISVSSLSPDCNYLLEINEENNTNAIQYFKKMFKTKGLDLKLNLDLATTNSLSYILDFGLSIDVKSANVSLYDEEGIQVGTTYTVFNGEDSYVVFDELEKNTTYNVKVDSVIFYNTNYASTYTINSSDTTLKEKPVLGELSVKTDAEEQNFTLIMEEPNDLDNSITKYTYEIYKADDLTEENISKAVPVYVHSQEALEDVTLGLGENLVEKQDYRFKVIAEYYDNYKYNEVETGFSDYFQVVGKPKIEFEPEVIDFNQIKGTIKIIDEGCLIPFEGRECFDGENDIVIRYNDGLSSVDGNFVQDSENLNQYNMDFELSDLIQNTTYLFEVYSNIDMKNGNGLQIRQYIGDFSVKTKGIESLKMNWKGSNESTFDTPISVNTELIPSVADSDYGDKLATLTFKLYRGDAINGIKTDPIKELKVTEDIKSKYYNREFTITSNMFGVTDLDELRELSGGKLNRYYTIEVTDAYDESETNKFDIMDSMHLFEVPSILLIEDEVEEPTIIVEEITNEMLKSGNYEKVYDSNLGDLIVVGYRVTADFKKDKIENYFAGENPIKTINFHVYSNGREINLSYDNSTIDLTKENTQVKDFFLGYGTDYSVVDDDLRRGNSYTFSYDISIDTDNNNEVDSYFTSSMPTSDEYTSSKNDHSFKLYIDNSTDNSITYKYRIVDYDNALYGDYEDLENIKYYFYYNVNGGEEEYKSEIVKQEEYSDVIISNLSNSDIYNISYYRASTKKESSISKVSIGKYLFDGVYDANAYNLGYRLEYGNFDNRLKIIIEDNEFLNRVSAYLVTLDAGSEKYQVVVSDLSTCDEDKCVIVDYSDIENLKGKDIEVYLEAFYDTGYVGFSQTSKLGNYFQSLNLVDSADASSIGFVYQDNSITERGKYFYLNSNGAFDNPTSIPRGILGFTLVPGKTSKDIWKLTTVNLINMSNSTFVSYGDISKTINVYPQASGIFETPQSIMTGSFNPKVLDKVNIQTDDNKFKFTSITPRVLTTHEEFINGATINIDLSITESILESDFVKTDGKYKFYVDLYTKNECSSSDNDCNNELVYLKSIETDYDNLNDITFMGLDPDTTYYYKISADMNKNNQPVKTPLFDQRASGYVEYLNSFKTYDKDDIFESVSYNYKSTITETEYSNRILNISSSLINNVNFDIKYEIYDIDGVLKYENTIANADIASNNSKFIAKYSQDITGRDFVFGVNYYTLVIYAVTTDLGKTLELYNEKMKNGGLGEMKDIGELINPVFTVSQEAVINDGASNFGINYTITVKDEDKVINNGIYNIELQNASYDNACPGHEEDCMAVVDIKNGTCDFGGGNSNCTIINQDQNGNQQLKISFNNLKADTNYIIYVYADTYRNNVSLAEKEGLVYVRKSQYTKSELGFSLGAVTPTAVSENKLVITFTGASNLEKKLKKIEYNINEIGAGKIAEGVLEIGKNVYFGKDKDAYPTLEIPLDSGAKLGLNNYIILTYYYEDNAGNLQLLMFGDENNKQYTVKNEK